MDEPIPVAVHDFENPLGSILIFQVDRLVRVAEVFFKYDQPALENLLEFIVQVPALFYFCFHVVNQNSVSVKNEFVESLGKCFQLRLMILVYVLERDFEDISRHLKETRLFFQVLS